MKKNAGSCRLIARNCTPSRMPECDGHKWCVINMSYLKHTDHLNE